MRRPSPDLVARLKTVSQWVWISLVVVIVVRWSLDHGDEIGALVERIGVLDAVATVLVTLGGKYTVAVQARLTTELLDRQVAPRRMFWLYSASDMAKYVPGGVWNLVARVKSYRDLGMTTPDAARAFGLEKFWQISGACFFGLLLLTPNLHDRLLVDRLGIEPHRRTALVVEMVVVVAAWILTTAIGSRILLGRRPDPRTLVRAIGDQVVMGILLGVGLWIPLAALTDIDPALAIGAFALGRAAGYAAVFAPGGVGVREVVSLWALGSAATANTLIIGLAINRILTVVADITGFGLALATRPPAQPTTEPPPHRPDA